MGLKIFQFSDCNCTISKIPTSCDGFGQLTHKTLVEWKNNTKNTEERQSNKIKNQNIYTFDFGHLPYSVP